MCMRIYRSVTLHSGGLENERLRMCRMCMYVCFFFSFFDHHRPRRTLFLCIERGRGKIFICPRIIHIHIQSRQSEWLKIIIMATVATKRTTKSAVLFNPKQSRPWYADFASRPLFMFQPCCFLWRVFTRIPAMRLRYDSDVKSIGRNAERDSQIVHWWIITE